jgi:hypothetical protein
MTPSDNIIPQKVTEWELRAIWNNAEFQRAFLKRCTERVMVTERLAPLSAEQIPGALSRVYDLFDNTAESPFLGTFHQYLNPDGSIGASGKLDPKMLVVGGVLMCDP